MKLKIKRKMTFKERMLWMLLHFLPTYKNCDNSGKGFATVVYVKKFRGDLYIWKVKYIRGIKPESLEESNNAEL